MVPPDYPKKLEANIPAEFAGLPRLLGRATVRKSRPLSPFALLRSPWVIYQAVSFLIGRGGEGRCPAS